MKIAFAVFAALGAVLLLLLAQAAANTARFAAYYPWLLGVNALAAATLLALIAAQLRRLWRDFRGGVFGSRLKARLLLMLALMAVFPGALVYAVSMQFAVKSIDSWFDVRVDAALEGGLSLGRSVLDTLQAEALDKARDMASALGDGTGTSVPQLTRQRERAGVETAVILTAGGQVLTSSSGDLGSLLPPLPSSTQLRGARGGRGVASVAEGDHGGLFVRVLVPLTGNGFTVEPRILQVTQPVPAAIAASAASVEGAHREYQELQLGREGLKRIYTLTLTLTLLLAFFAAIGLAFVLAERIARPLLILAEGTSAVAAGDFTPRATVAASDELGVLTHSFNSMTHQLGEARADAERHRSELEAAQAYLESVLANLSAGVLAFDAGWRLRAANRGALTILGDDLADLEHLPLTDWPRHEALSAAVTEGFARRGTEWQEQLEIARGDGLPQALLVRGRALPEAGGGGYVVVFDDITRLIAAQRSAAWGEVARRLAHEIKNPLTPIQLSAERLRMKLDAKLDDAGRDLLQRATTTIVNQVEAMKNMVNDFRDYARTPPPVLAPVDLRALVEEVLQLYESAAVRPRLAEAAVAPLPLSHPLSHEGREVPLASLSRSGRGIEGEGTPTFALADATQMRQVLHNLLTNAGDALAETAQPRIDLALAVDGARLRLTIVDNGPGFQSQILARAFEPYVTTKSKGTGLGLAIVKKIVEDHGGEIRLANRAAGGGEVTLWLPRAPDAKEHEGEA